MIRKVVNVNILLQFHNQYCNDTINLCWEYKFLANLLYEFHKLNINIYINTFEIKKEASTFNDWNYYQFKVLRNYSSVYINIYAQIQDDDINNIDINSIRINLFKLISWHTLLYDFNKPSSNNILTILLLNNQKRYE